MRKKLISLQRWLNRLTVAYNKNELTSAMVEADCLSAELEGIRDELWCEVEGEVACFTWRGILLKKLPRLCTVAAISLFAICTVFCSITQDIMQVAFTSSLKTERKVRIDNAGTLNKDLMKSENKLFVKRRNKTKSVIVLNGTKFPESRSNKNANKDIVSKAKGDQKTSEVLLTLVQVGEQSLRSSSGNKFIIRKNIKLQSKERSL